MDTLNQLLTLNLEIEGLLRTLKARPDADEALKLLLKKNADFQAVLESFELPSSEEPEETETVTEETVVEPEESNTIVTADVTKATVADNITALPEFKVEDMIAQQEAGDLSRAFSINDKYRFIRDLFGNNKNKFDDTINRVVGMKSLTQAYEYFLDELAWDADDPAAGDFLSIIANHFNSVK